MINIFSLAKEFLKVSDEELLDLIKNNLENSRKEWETRISDEDFYKNTKTLIIGLVEFNNKERLTNFYHPVQNLRDLKVLDFGGGIGTLSFLLSPENKVDYYDLPSITQDFAKFMNTKMECGVNFIETPLPSGNIVSIENNNLHPINFLNKTYDLVIAFDVLEHLRDPIDTIKKLDKLLKRDGLFYTTGLDFSFSNPLHIKENADYREELMNFFYHNYRLMYYYVTPNEVLYLWKKR